jgi:hypothetical protein
MTPMSDTAAEASIGAATRELRLPVIRSEASRMAEAALRDRVSHLGYLADVLAAEVDERAERRRGRRVTEARFPRMKRLGDFDDTANPVVGAEPIALLASCTFLERGEPVVFLGDSGTGKSHLLIGTGLAACELGKRVRYVTCAGLVNKPKPKTNGDSLDWWPVVGDSIFPCSTNSVTCSSTPAGQNCCSGSSRSERRRHRSPSCPICLSPNGERQSQIRDWLPPWSTG